MPSNPDLAELERASLYERDFYAWTQEQAAHLRAGRLGAVDLANLAEEVRDMAGRERRELLNRVGVLLVHLIKHHYANETRPLRGWAATILEQRRAIALQLEDSPSLRRHLTDAEIERAYLSARSDALLLANYDAENAPPETCPYGIDDILDVEFWPRDHG